MKIGDGWQNGTPIVPSITSANLKRCFNFFFLEEGHLLAVHGWSDRLSHQEIMLKMPFCQDAINDTHLEGPLH
jgi:hypothetical protein